MARYAARISGPLLDRIDLHVEVPAVAWRELESGPSEPCSARVRVRVAEARRRQRARLARWSARTNAEIPDRALDEAVEASPEARALLGRAVDRLRLSARGARRLLRVARTVADLEGDPAVGPAAMAEALGYRRGEP